MVDKVKQGKRNRANGAAFELRVRKDLECKGWRVDKWSNNVEFREEPKYLTPDGVATTINQFITIGKLIPAKRKYNSFSKVMAIGTGFPDFVAFSLSSSCENKTVLNLPNGQDIVGCNGYNVIGTECKSNGKLDKIEKEKCRWMLNNKIFSRILIAEKTKVKNNIVIIYHDFEEKYGKV